MSTGQGVLGYNMFAYCGNNAVNYVDPTGTVMCVAHSPLHASNKSSITIPDYFTPSNCYGTIVSGSAIISGGMCLGISNSIKRSVRPANIGIGLHAKQCENDLRLISKFDKNASKTFGALAYGVAVIDVGLGIYDNVQNNASTKKIVLDATVDAAISGGSMWAAGAAGGAAGTAVGSVIPGAGNLVGAGVGFVIGVGLYIVTDMIDFNGKTARNWVKEGVNSLW